MESEVYNEQNCQECANRDIFKFIASDFDFYLYPDIFADNNLSSLCFNVTP